MPRLTQGSTYQEAGGTIGIRWPEAGGRPQRGGFRNATEARRWFRDNIAPTLGRGPSSAIIYAAFCDLYIVRWSPGKATRTIATLTERLAPSLAQFGSWRLAELEAAVDDVVAWRATLPTEHARYKATRAMRQVLNGAVRWKYIASNPAQDFGANRQPRPREVDPFTVAEIDAIAEELGPRYGPLVVFAAETGLRTNEWIALERRDVDRRHHEVVVRHRVTDGEHYADPKTDRHVVPLDPPRRSRARPTPGAHRHAARVPRRRGRLPQPRQLAPPRMGARAPSRRPQVPRPLLTQAHVRRRSTREGHADLRPMPADGDVAGDDRAPLRAPRQRPHRRDARTAVPGQRCIVVEF